MIKNSDFIILSDMDGTLTLPRQKMDAEFASELYSFIKDCKFYIVTGSDLSKIKEQISDKIMNSVFGIFASMGNEFYVHNKIIYKNDFYLPDEITDKLNYYRNNTEYPYDLYSNFIEKRCGMVNFCVLGRDCPFEARKKYQEWDLIHQERKKIAKTLSLEFPKYSFTIGGAISIDIVQDGYGKSQVADRLREIYKTEKIIFFGDKTEEGGNDYDLAKRLLYLGNSEIINVNSKDDVIHYLKRITANI